MIYQNKQKTQQKYKGDNSYLLSTKLSWFIYRWIVHSSLKINNGNMHYIEMAKNQFSTKC